MGRILRAEPNERARKPAYKLWIDFGPLGEKTSSAQLRALYAAEELVGRLVVAAVNLGTRNIAGFTSEVLVLGLPDEAGRGGAAGGRARGAARRAGVLSGGLGSLVRHRPHHQAGDRAVLGQAPLDQHRAARRVERRGALVDAERRGVVHPLVERALLGPSRVTARPAKLARSPTLPKVCRISGENRSHSFWYWLP